MQPMVSILSNLRIAGAIVLDKNETDFPPGSPGMLIIKDQCLYAYLTISGMETWYPLLRQTSRTYVHTQGAVNDVWTVNHQLDSVRVWYQVQDETNAIMHPASYEEVDANTFKLHFSEPVMGTVFVVGLNDIDVAAIKASIINVGDTVTIDTGGMLIDGKRVITGVKMNVGDGNATRLVYTDAERLNFVPGVGIQLSFDDVTKSIIINAPGVSMTPEAVEAKIAAALEEFKSHLYSYS